MQKLVGLKELMNKSFKEIQENINKILEEMNKSLKSEKTFKIIKKKNC